MALFFVGLGIVTCLSMIGFVLVRAYRQAIKGPLAAAILAGSAVPLLAFPKIGADLKYELPGGAGTLETFARRAEDAAETATADKQVVEALRVDVQSAANEVRTTAAALRDLETRYRHMIGNTAQLVYLTWRVRGRFGSMPTVEGRLSSLADDLLNEAYPNPNERSRIIGEINGMSPPTGAAISVGR